MFLSKYTCDDCDKRISRKTSPKNKTETLLRENFLTKKEKNNHTNTNNNNNYLTNTKFTADPLTNNTNSPPKYTSLIDTSLAKIYDSVGSEQPDWKTEFDKKYLGRRGRRKGSFHLKRDLVSYRVLPFIQNSSLDYCLIKPETKTNNLYKSPVYSDNDHNKDDNVSSNEERPNDLNKDCTVKGEIKKFKKMRKVNFNFFLNSVLFN